MLDGMFDAIARPLAFFYDIIPSYGVAIILLTLAVMLLLTPLTLTGTKSMINMQRMQPELKKIQEKHKDDREKLNAEMMAFYQENNINPIMGCLPMLLQIPVFLILFNVVRGLTNRAGGLGSGIGSAARQAGQAGDGLGAATPWDPPFAPDRLDPSSSLFQDLSRDTEMTFLGFDLSESAQSALGQGALVSAPFLIMIVIVGVTSWYQQRQIQARTTTSNGRSPQSDQQQMIMKIMPWMLPVFSFTMPAALVLYFIASNIYRVGQQHFITRTMHSDSEAQSGSKSGSKSGDDDKKSKGGSKNGTSKASGSSNDLKSALAARGGKNSGRGRNSGRGGKNNAANQRSNQRRERAKSASGSQASITPRERTTRRKKRN